MKKYLLALAVGVASLVGAGAAVPASASDHVTIAFVGDIACEAPISGVTSGDPAYNGGDGSGNRCKQKAVSDLVTTDRIDKVVTLGDNQYEVGSLSQFNKVYGPTMGRVKSKTIPTCGNHEYKTSGAQGFVDYFGQTCKWRSVLLADEVRLITLDTEKSMAVGSSQYNFVKNELINSGSNCVFLAGHKPRYSSGSHGNYTSVDPIWELGLKYGAAAMFSGHDHSAQRYLPRGSSSEVTSSGMIQFVSGAGGKSIYPKTKDSAAKYITTHGIYEVTPHPTQGTFDYRYVGIDGVVHDSGTASCRRPV